jgi:hypothetical protein
MALKEQRNSPETYSISMPPGMKQHSLAFSVSCAWATCVLVQISVDRLADCGFLGLCRFGALSFESTSVGIPGNKSEPGSS